MQKGHSTSMQFLDTDLIYRRLIYGDNVVAVFFFPHVKLSQVYLTSICQQKTSHCTSTPNFFTPCPLKLKKNWIHADYL